MTSRVSVCYGHPTDPAAFDDHYTRVHLPLAAQIPGLTELTWGKTQPIGAEPPYYAVAQLVFVDRASLDAALASPEMAAAGKDVRKFATGGVTMFILDDHPAVI